MFADNGGEEIGLARNGQDLTGRVVEPQRSRSRRVHQGGELRPRDGHDAGREEDAPFSPFRRLEGRHRFPGRDPAGARCLKRRGVSTGIRQRQVFSRVQGGGSAGRPASATVLPKNG